MINLERIAQISFGNKSLMAHMLLTAEEDINTTAQVLSSFDELETKEQFRVMHNLKTTLIILQASELIPECQIILTSIENDAHSTWSNKIPLLQEQLKLIELEIAQVRKDL
jgi:hypothetical protein